MRWLIFPLFSFYLFGAVHYAKVEPINRYTIKSAATGKVVWSAQEKEGKVVNGVIVKIDSKIDKKELQNSLKTKEITKKSLTLAKELLPLLRENFQRQKRYFERLSSLDSSSQNQKDLAFGAMVSAKNQLISTRDKILNLQKQLSDIDFKIAMLRDRIEKKSIKVKNLYLYKLFVKRDDFVNLGRALAIVDDLSRAKVTIYLSKEELEHLNSSSIYIQGKKTNLKFSKVWKETDEKFVSSYRAEIILEPKYKFSSLIKVEIK